MQPQSTVHRKRFLSTSSFPPIFLQRDGCERGVDDDGKEDDVNEILMAMNLVMNMKRG